MNPALADLGCKQRDEPVPPVPHGLVADFDATSWCCPHAKEAVETPFFAEMREAARLAIYRAMAADADPRPAYEDWARACEASIDIAPPSSGPGAPASPISTIGANRRNASRSVTMRW